MNRAADGVVSGATQRRPQQCAGRAGVLLEWGLVELGEAAEYEEKTGRPEVAQVLGEIRDLARLRDLEVRVTHTGPGTMVHLERAQALAEAATARARRSANSPACPHCGDRMAVRELRTSPRRGSRVWGCTNFPDCRGTIPLYEPRD